MSSVQPGQSGESSTRVVVAAGVARFAGIMLSVMGVLEILQGVSAIATDSVFVRGLSYTYEFDVTTWGWIHVIIGATCVAVGIAIVMRQTVGYLAGIAAAFLAAVASFMFLPYYPLWALVLIAFNVFVIWALCGQLGRDRVDEDYYADQETVTGSSMGSDAATATEPAEPGLPSPGTPPSQPS